ncbi:MAG: Hint domain-containing protein [Pseudomonadota bacterium]
MPRISELHYSNAYARNSGEAEFLEVALGASDDPADFVVGFYQDDGSLGIEVRLDDPRVTSTVDPDNGEVVYVLSADALPILLTDPNGSGSNNYEAYALTNTGTGEVLDFYDIGGGTQNIVAQSGAAAGAVSENLPVVVGPDATTTSIQFNQPNPDQITYAALGAGDTGVACFVAGSQVDTPSGPRRIEALIPGDMVLTVDDGAMPVRWVGRRTVVGQGAMAPVCFDAGAYGATAPVYVSPQHRILVGGWRAQLYFGEDEVLIPAKALVNGDSVRYAPRGTVTYVHVLFDSHQILRCAGLCSESYFPVSAAEAGWSHDTEQELLSLFPALADLGTAKTARVVQPVRHGAVLQAA